MTIETVHTGSKVVDPMTEIGDLHFDIVPPNGWDGPDDLCAHTASSHDESVFDERCDSALDRHVGNVKALGQGLDRRQLSAHCESTANDLDTNGRGHTRVPRDWCLSRICHTSTLPKRSDWPARDPRVGLANMANHS
jgi:hypothetical protein